MTNKPPIEHLSFHEVDAFLQRQPKRFREIALELRNLVLSIAPEATERILWGGLSYHEASRGGPVKGAICQIEIHREHVRLSFIHGVNLHDPESLLSGKRLSKRYVRLDDYERIPWDALAGLITSARDYSPEAFSN
jgi:hypothetical protein